MHTHVSTTANALCTCDTTQEVHECLAVSHNKKQGLFRLRESRGLLRRDGGFAEGREAAVSALRSWAGGESLGCARPPR